MKKLFAIAFLLVIVIGSQCFSQNFNWQWARYAQQNTVERLGSSYGWSTACNASVGVYVTGWITDTTIFSSDTVDCFPLLQPLRHCFYLARYDAAGNIRWARSPISTSPHGIFNAGAISSSYGVASDAAGNAYITGSFTDTLSIDTLVLLSASSEGIFVTKYDSSGNALWAKAPQGNGGGQSTAITAYANSSIYVCGNFTTPTFSFDTTVLVNAGTTNAFLLKYDSAGNEIWALSTAGNLDVYANGVATDDSGNVYITGYFIGDTLKIANTIIYIVDTSYYKLFTAKFNSAGNLIWVKSAACFGGGFSEATSVAADTHGNVYVTGGLAADSVIIDSTTVVSNSLFFLIKYDSQGNLRWFKDNEYPGGVQILGYCVTTDINDNVYVSAGETNVKEEEESTFMIDSVVILVPGVEFPLLLFEIDSDGRLLHGQGFPSGGLYQNWVCVDRMGNGYLGGAIDYRTNVIFGNDTAFQTGGDNMFIAKFNPDSLACNLGPPTINAETNSICDSDSALICAPTGFALYQWNTGQTTACFYTNVAGNYYVTVTDGHGCDATSNTVAITVNTPPPLSITVNGDTLTANNGVSFQWYLNDSVIAGATTHQIIGSKGGSYTVQITDSNGCSATSNPVTISTINQLLEGAISIYPNPSNGNWLLATSNNLIGAAIEVCDATGNVVFKSAIKNQKTEIQIPGIAAGVYFLRVNTGEGVLVRKLVKM